MSFDEVRYSPTALTAKASDSGLLSIVLVCWAAQQQAWQVAVNYTAAAAAACIGLVNCVAAVSKCLS